MDNAKAIDCVDHNQLWKSLEDKVISDYVTCLLRNLYAGQVQKQQLELNMEQQTGSK